MTIATYAFHYNISPSIDRGCYNSDSSMPLHWNVPVLTGIDLPDGSSWQIATYTTGDATPTCRQGAVQNVVLPTLGKIEYDYRQYSFPNASDPGGRGGSRTLSPGVAHRTKYDQNGALLGQWGFTSALGDNLIIPNVGHMQRELKVTVTTPQGDTFDQYWSVAVDGWTDGDWNGYEYALPFTRNATVPRPDPTRLQSTVIKQGGTTIERTVYVTYEMDAVGDISTGLNDYNRRLTKSRTVFNDDANSYVGVVYNDPSDGLFVDSFDGLGHFRTARTEGTFAAGNTRITRTNYNPNRGTYPGSFTMLNPTDPWILDTFDYSSATENGVAAKSLFCFESTTGFLLRSLVLKNPASDPSVIARSPNDILTINRETLWGIRSVSNTTAGTARIRR